MERALPEGSVAGRPVLLYDGECGLCRRAAAMVRAWDRPGRVALVPSQRRDEVPGLPPLAAEPLTRALHLVDPAGIVWAGAEALQELLRYLPGGWVVRWVFYLPGAPWLADRAYRWVAARRHRLGCGTADCALTPEPPTG